MVSIEGCSVRDLAWLTRAATIARSGSGRSNHGAVVVKGGRVIGYGTNTSRTHERWEVGRARSQCSIHAEVSAMRRASTSMGATIYVARVNACGTWRRSAPCSNCFRYLENNGIKRIVHT